MKKYLCVLVLIFIFCLTGCKKEEVRFRYTNTNALLGEVRKLDIESEFDIINIEVLTIDSSILDIIVKENEVYIRGNYIGIEKVVCKINDMYEISTIVNVVGEKIYLGEIFNKEEEPYYIYFYKDNCAACVNTLPFVLSYENENYFDEDEYEKIYFCKFESSSLEFSIHRPYLGEDGEGASGKSKVTGVESIEELCVYSVPTLIKVENGELKFIADGANSVKNFIERLGRLEKNDD